MHDEILNALKLCRSCACKPSCYGFMCVKLLSCPSDNIFRALFPILWPYYFVLPFHNVPNPELWNSGRLISMSHLQLAVHSCLSSALWTALSLHTDHYPLQLKNWLGLREAHIYGYNHGYLEGILKTRPQIQSRGQEVTHINNLATIATVEMSFWEGHCCNIQGPVLSKTIDVFSPVTDCTVTSSPMKVFLSHFTQS